MSTVKRIIRNLVFWLPLIGLCILIGLIVFLLNSGGYITFLRHGPNIIISTLSPDGRYNAYVVEAPSFDPPNQVLFIERSDKTHFMYISHLAEDVDFIKEILWSPYNDIVVFHTKDHLIATYLPEYQTIKIYLGKEWDRRTSVKGGIYSSCGASHRVEEIKFSEAGIFRYRLEGLDKFRTIQMGSLSQN